MKCTDHRQLPHSWEEHGLCIVTQCWLWTLSKGKFRETCSFLHVTPSTSTSSFPPLHYTHPQILQAHSAPMRVVMALPEPAQIHNSAGTFQDSESHLWLPALLTSTCSHLYSHTQLHQPYILQPPDSLTSHLHYHVCPHNGPLKSSPFFILTFRPNRIDSPLLPCFPTTFASPVRYLYFSLSCSKSRSE